MVTSPAKLNGRFEKTQGEQRGNNTVTFVFKNQGELCMLNVPKSPHLNRYELIAN